MTRPASVRKGHPVTIRGIAYPSQAAAGRALGVSEAVMSRAKSSGCLDKVGLQGMRPKRIFKPKRLPAPNSHPVVEVIIKRPVQQGPLHKHLSSVFHPRWCSRDDHIVMAAKAAGCGFAAIAVRLGRPCVAIEQSWHRLRAIPDIVKRLKAYGLTDVPYPDGGSLHEH